MDIAERNREIKKLLTKTFGNGKVTVRGSRGTAYGWVTVKIAYAPRNWRERQELASLVERLLDAADIKIGSYGTPGDMGCDYGWGRKIHINFLDCREEADTHGDEAWKHHLSAEDWDALQRREAA